MLINYINKCRIHKLSSDRKEILNYVVGKVTLYNFHVMEL